MAEQDNLISRPGTSGAGGVPGSSSGVVGRFQSLPRGGQIAIVLGVVFGAIWLFGGSGGGGGNAGNPTLGTMQQGGGVSGTQAFAGINTDRPAVMQNVYEQNRREMAEFRNRIEDSFQQRDRALQDAISQNQELQRQMTQMMSDFTAEIKNIQLERAKDAERLSQIADQQHQMELNAPVDGSGAINPAGRQRQRINQVSLGGGGGGALLSPLGVRGMGGSGGEPAPRPSTIPQGSGARLPFIPPIGFVRATLLNGVDALVGGTPTPALARVEGVYKTAMNSTVNLDGCFAMVEFNGNISTERAIGKPTRMTCVYPDGGAATYTLSGYVVDAEDGIIGVPGLLYEGDPTRIAASMLADFAAGIGEIVTNNQTTNTVSADGISRQTITGDQTKAEIAGGVDKAMSSLRNYLLERVNRVQPFIRLDATREVHLVILTGTELRSEAGAWTLLFDAEAADAARAAGSPANVTQATGAQTQ